MAGGAGVGEEGEFPEVAGKVGAADAHAVGADDSFAGGGSRFVGAVDDGDFLRFGEFDGVHREEGLDIGYLKLGEDLGWGIFHRKDAEVAKGRGGRYLGFDGVEAEFFGGLVVGGEKVGTECPHDGLGLQVPATACLTASGSGAGRRCV